MIPPADTNLFDRINAALPQTQCTRCGYPNCAAYAQAIASNKADINQCPPGGAEGVERLSSLTGRPASPLNPAHGSEGPRAVVFIDEAWCIGCTLCLKACPTDAIMGSNKMMHTVIEAYCTGCELCIPVCPVDCISLENVTGTRTGWNAWSAQQAQTAKQRYQFHCVQEAHSDDEKTTAPKSPIQPESQPEMVKLPNVAADSKRLVIEAVLARARAQREQKL